MPSTNTYLLILYAQGRLSICDYVFIFVAKTYAGFIIMNEHIYTLAIALTGSAGFWSFMTIHQKNKGNPAGEYQQTLKSQIDGLAKRLDAKDEKIEHLLGEISNLRSDLSAAKVNITHLETMLRIK